MTMKTFQPTTKRYRRVFNLNVQNFKSRLEMNIIVSTNVIKPS